MSVNQKLTITSNTGIIINLTHTIFNSVNVIFCCYFRVSIQRVLIFSALKLTFLLNKTI